MVVLFLLLFVHLASSSAALQVGFYQKTCPNVESIIEDVVKSHFRTDRSVPAALLRMHFHDCFVRGCDASILIDSTKSQQSEKAAGANLSVRGFEIIEEAKAKLEAHCPSTVSCADIIALATRDAIALSGGHRYNVPTGRRDGLISRSSDVNLPGPSLSISQALQSFKAKGMTLEDMVTLLGAHTVGVAQCVFFQDRLLNFQASSKPDPTMDPVLRVRLAQACSRGSKATAFLDQNTSFVMDNQFYNQILARKGVLQIDQALAMDKSSVGTVKHYGNDEKLFLQKFAIAMVKMGNIEVLVGRAGEIRKKCNVFNAPKKS